MVAHAPAVRAGGGALGGTLTVDRRAWCRLLVRPSFGGVGTWWVVGVGVVNALLGPEAIAVGDPRTGHLGTSNRLLALVLAGRRVLDGGSVRCLRTAQWTRASKMFMHPRLWWGCS